MPEWSGEIRRGCRRCDCPPSGKPRLSMSSLSTSRTVTRPCWPQAIRPPRPSGARGGSWKVRRPRPPAVGHRPPRRPGLAGLEVAPRGRLLRGLWHDVRYAVRNLRKRAMLSATIIATLAISLGPTAAVIGMADALFFIPLPVVAGQDRLLHYAFGTPRRDGFIPHQISYANLAEIRDGATTVAGIAGQTANVWLGTGRCRASSRPRHGDHRQLLRRAWGALDRRTNLPLRGRLARRAAIR